MRKFLLLLSFLSALASFHAYPVTDKIINLIFERRGDIGYFHEGLATCGGVNLPNGTRIPYCYIDQDGNMAINADKYDRICDFHEGLAAVRLIREKNKEDKWGFIDIKGNVIVQPQYGYVSDFSEDRAIVSVKEFSKRHTIIDKNGTVIVPEDSWTYDDFHNGVAVRRSGDRPWCYIFIDKFGKEIPKFGVSITYSGREPLALKDGYTTHEGNTLIDINGYEVWKLPYDHIIKDINLEDNRFLIEKADDKKDSKYGYSDRNGKIVIPLKYNWAFPFKDGRAVVVKKHKWGLIDVNNKNITPFKYDEFAYDYRNGPDEFGLYAVEIGDYFESAKKGVINQNGVEILPCEYDYLKITGFGIIYAEKGGVRYLYDTRGNLIQSRGK